MPLTETQIETIFEWLDKEAGRKTAIRFVKEFYVPEEIKPKYDPAEAIREYKEQGMATWVGPTPIPCESNSTFSELLQMKAMANMKNQAREKYPEGTNIKTPEGEVVEVVEIYQDYTHRSIKARCKIGDIERVEDVLIYHELNDLDVYWAEIVK